MITNRDDDVCLMAERRVRGLVGAVPVYVVGVLLCSYSITKRKSNRCLVWHGF